MKSTNNKYYIAQDGRDAFVHVLLHSRTEAPTVERASARTHLIPAVVFGIFAILRTYILGDDSVASYMLTVTAAVAGLMFATSTAFHVYQMRDFLINC